MNRKIKWKGVRRATAALLAGPLPADKHRRDWQYVPMLQDGGKKLATAETAATPETAAPADLSERAQAFIDAVNALDRDGMVAASNAWGLAHEAWLADPDNAELEAALNEATAAQEEACAPLSEAEELYNQILRSGAQRRAGTGRLCGAGRHSGRHLHRDGKTPPRPGRTGRLNWMRSAVRCTATCRTNPPAAISAAWACPSPPARHGSPSRNGVTDLYDGVDAHIDAAALHADGEIIAVERMAGEDYAIVPIMVQVEYPANGSATEIILPDSVTLLDYEGNAADAEEAENILRASYTDTSAAAHGIYVQAAQDFTAEFMYTASTGRSCARAWKSR